MFDHIDTEALSSSVESIGEHLAESHLTGEDVEKVGGILVALGGLVIAVGKWWNNGEKNEEKVSTK